MSKFKYLMEKANFTPIVEKISDKDGMTSIKITPDTAPHPIKLDFKSDYKTPQEIGIHFMQKHPGKLKEVLLATAGQGYACLDKAEKQMIEMHVATRMAIATHSQVGKNMVQSAQFKVDDIEPVNSPYPGDKTQHFSFTATKNGKPYVSGTFSYGMHKGDSGVSAKLSPLAKETVESILIPQNMGSKPTTETQQQSLKAIGEIEDKLKTEGKRYFGNKKSQELSLSHDNVVSFSR